MAETSGEAMVETETHDGDAQQKAFWKKMRAAMHIASACRQVTHVTAATAMSSVLCHDHAEALVEAYDDGTVLGVGGRIIPMELPVARQLLKSVKLYDGMSETVAAKLPEIVERVVLPQGTVLFQQGDPPGNCYIILSGTLGIDIAARKDRDALVAEAEARLREPLPARPKHSRPAPAATPTTPRDHLDQESSNASPPGTADKRSRSRCSAESAGHDQHVQCGRSCSLPRVVNFVEAEQTVSSVLRPEPCPPTYASTEQQAIAIFAKFDNDGSGSLEKKELRAALRELGIDAKSSRATAALKKYDEDGSGCLEIDEFKALAQDLLASSKPKTRKPMIPFRRRAWSLSSWEQTRLRHTNDGFSVYREGADLGKQVAVVGDGSLLGEMALLRDAPRMSSVCCLEDVDLLLIHKDKFEEVVKGDLQRVRMERQNFLQAHVPGLTDPFIWRAACAHPYNFFKRASFPKGHRFLLQGSVAEDAVYVLFSGTVELIHRPTPLSTWGKLPSNKVSLQKQRALVHARSEGALTHACPPLERRVNIGAVVPITGVLEQGSPKARLKPVMTLVSGAMFGSLLPLSGRTPEPFTAVAAQPCDVFFVPSHEVQKLPGAFLERLRNYLTETTRFRLGRVDRKALERGPLAVGQPVAWMPKT